jgi:murein DD-endopeptidase MepM/ murein hydrolase activator NlpD
MSQLSLRPSSAPSARPRRSSRSAGALATLLTAAVLVVGAAPAAADPVNPSDGEITDAATAQQAAAAEVTRIAGLVTAAEEQLERVQVEAEAAGTAYLAAEEERQLAEKAAAKAARALKEATAAVEAAQLRIADFSRDSYMNGSALTSEMALLDVEGPTELVQKAALLEYVADHQLDVLGLLEVAQVAQANADSAARAARDEKAAAEARASAAKEAADAQLAGQRRAVEQVTAQKASLDQQLQAAEVRVLELQGARNAYEQWVAQKEAEAAAAAAAQQRAQAEAAAAARRAVTSGGGGGGGGGGGASVGSAGYVRPASGRVSSCFGARWGVTHFGVDIAAPIGTPVYAATSGVVQRAGAATGFGLAVYIRGNDGAITVYGHVNRYYVSAGERVTAGEQIAEVGNRGQSTGPHLHFEVHPGGTMYSGQVDPAPWLRTRGIALDRC